MRDIDIVMALLGGLVVIVGLLGRAVQRAPVSLPLVALAAGAAVGPSGIDVVDPGKLFDVHALLEHASRIVLSIGVMGIALALPPGYVGRSLRSVVALLGVLMPIMTLAAALVAHVALNVAWVPALLVGAILAPTDPILGRSVVTGVLARHNLPERLRNLLLAESGANDGLAFPLVMLPLAIGYRNEDLPHWFAHVLLYQVVVAALAGAALGLLAGRAMAWAEDRRLLDDAHFLVFSVALSLFALGLARLVDLDGILMVFVAGLGLARGCRTERLRRQRAVQDSLNEVLTAALFLLFGMLAPWQEWMRLGWSAVALVLGVLLLRRLPWLVLLARDVPLLDDRREGAVAGWFGPIGVGAVFYAALAERAGVAPVVWNVSTLMVAASVVAYAVTSPALVNWYGRSAAGRNAPAT